MPGPQDGGLEIKIVDMEPAVLDEVKKVSVELGLTCAVYPSSVRKLQRGTVDCRLNQITM